MTKKTRTTITVLVVTDQNQQRRNGLRIDCMSVCDGVIATVGDVNMVIAGPPAAVAKELMETAKVRFINVETDIIEAMKEKYGYLLITAIGLFTTLFHLYMNSWWGFTSAHILRITHWTCLSGLTLLTFSLGKNERTWWTELIDWVLFFVAVGAGTYMLVSRQGIVMSGGDYSEFDAIMSMLLVLIILEATRRGVSQVLAVTAAIFLAYALWGHFIGGIFGHRRYGYDRVFAFLATTPEAVFGIPIGVSATYMPRRISFSDCSSPCSCITSIARLNGKLDPRVVSVPCGWGHQFASAWQPANSTEGESGNYLIDDASFDKISGTPNYKSVVCEVRKKI